MRRPLLFIITIAILLSGFAPVPQADSPADPVEAAVTKIFVQSSPPNLFFPWQRAGLESLTGSGAIIDGDRILTNAHVVADAMSIEVKRAGESRRFVADVQYVGHDCDLALLTVKDKRFFAGSRSLPLGQLLPAESEVQVHGFPIGGENIAVSSGIVSRIEISTYAHSAEDLLLAQIDASINAGNSGGPVVADGELVGIAVQALDEGENLGYMIPAPVIDHFLVDVADGRYDGFPQFGAELQDLESPAHRASLGMSDDQPGVLVSRIDFGGSAHDVLRRGDVLMSIAGTPVANDLTVEWPAIGRVRAEMVHQSRQVGETLPVSILRDGKRMDLELELGAQRPLVPGRRLAAQAPYFTFGGLVFQPLTYEYLHGFEDVPIDLADWALYRNVATEQKRQLILLQKVLPHPSNRGYQELADYVVDTVNGIAPRDMEHLAEIVDGAAGPWLKIVTDDVTVITLSLDEARAAQPKILAGFGIARDRSVGLTAGDPGARASAR